VIRVVLLDDHELFRRCFGAMLESEEGISVVGDAGNIKAAYDVIEEQRPDVVVVDIELLDGSGIEATRKIRAEYENIEVLILTAHDEDRYRYDALRAGAAGYASKIEDFDTVVDKVRNLASEASVAQTLVIENNIAGYKPLTKTQRKVLELLAEGRTNKEIARALHLSERTITTHLVNAFKRLGVQNRVGAVTEARKRGEITG
jgi:DNA-binding NarL/FixJ family response regulator